MPRPSLYSKSRKVTVSSEAGGLWAPKQKKIEFNSSPGNCIEQLLEIQEKVVGCMRRIRNSFMQIKLIKKLRLFLTARKEVLKEKTLTMKYYWTRQ